MGWEVRRADSAGHGGRVIFRETEISGAFIVEPERIADERGFFARTWCRQEFADHGLNPRLAQCSLSYSRQALTMRGMHFQAAPHEEAKLVRCTRGALLDVIVDLRPHSVTYRRWISAELAAENGLAFYVPEGCAHGFLTLAPDTEVLYQMSVAHQPGSARGVRWNDPAFGIRWPADPAVISDHDRQYPDFAG